MIVYRKQESLEKTSGLFAGIKKDLNNCRRSGYSHDSAIELLIDMGEFESAVADALCPDVDAYNQVLSELRNASVLAAHLAIRTVEGKKPCGMETKLENMLEKLQVLRVPDTVTLRVSEGFAYYGLYPETYMEAARRFAADYLTRGKSKAVCIGLRTIGSALSALVAAVLENEGVEVLPLTVRPRGEPFERKLLIDRLLQKTIAGLKEKAWFLIVDEGPGLSGSTICSVADALSIMGIPDERIVMFTSWIPDGSDFISVQARQRWPRHRKYSVFFEDVFLGGKGPNAGLFGECLPSYSSECLDLSAGGWRRIHFKEKDYPAVHPHHERRKYLFCNEGRLLKFAGLGRYGRKTLARAESFDNSGYCPKAIGLSNGFLIMEYVNGRPMRASTCGYEFLETAAGYMAYVARKFPCGQAMEFADFREMVENNVNLSLGPRIAVAAKRRLDLLAGYYEPGRSVGLDGRMLPHEWLSTGLGFIKTDCTDHHADHFFPRDQDICWDVAGTVTEFGLGGAKTKFLLARYSEISGDRLIEKRLPLYMLSYPAFRIGYAQMAARQLGDTPEGLRFQRLADFYSSAIKAALS
ncbi:MAG: hypothetical protein M0Z52_02395 [Actinomycetota bacterium]|nr:hypothetical protein [Actinomycetota bacterium]